VVGYDLVCEEDHNPGLSEFIDILLEFKAKFKARWGEDFQFYFHAGESCANANTELYDAILMGTKRIGHGFGLIKHPNLVEIVKEKGICVECCPNSNILLGYCHDMRTHPVRSLLTRGVHVSISPDDPGFMDSPGVTLDYLLVYLAWDLDLMDLKKLCLNSLEHSTVSEQDKSAIREFFNYTWIKFLRFIRGNY
jgi:adenosine deaminase CECR1